MNSNEQNVIRLVDTIHSNSSEALDQELARFMSTVTLDQHLWDCFFNRVLQWAVQPKETGKAQGQAETRLLVELLKNVDPSIRHQTEGLIARSCKLFIRQIERVGEIMMHAFTDFFVNLYNNGVVADVSPYIIKYINHSLKVEVPLPSLRLLCISMLFKSWRCQPNAARDVVLKLQKLSQHPDLPPRSLAIMSYIRRIYDVKFYNLDPYNPSTTPDPIETSTMFLSHFDPLPTPSFTIPQTSEEEPEDQAEDEDCGKDDREDEEPSQQDKRKKKKKKKSKKRKEAAEGDEKPESEKEKKQEGEHLTFFKNCTSKQERRRVGVLIVEKALQQGTNKTYGACRRNLEKWCDEKQVAEPDRKLLVEYLNELFLAGHSYEGVASKSFLPMPEGVDITTPQGKPTEPKSLDFDDSKSDSSISLLKSLKDGQSQLTTSSNGFRYASVPEDLTTDDRVNVRRKGCNEPAGGMIRYIGFPDFSEKGHRYDGCWVGVELDEPTGSHNGTVDNVKYFECPPGHGVFVRATSLKQVPCDLAGQIFVYPQHGRKRILRFDIRMEALRTYGYKSGDLIGSESQQAWVVGVRQGILWWHIEGQNATGASAAASTVDGCHKLLESFTKKGESKLHNYLNEKWISKDKDDTNVGGLDPKTIETIGLRKGYEGGLQKEEPSRSWAVKNLQKTQNDIFKLLKIGKG
eukprot:TRINITY_DN462_c4_g1_i1.p1 TRINITY_DN462_c4_g1~~TRINITY_DN462_c4_g1_i1.p1  ORF type:complete len:688 (+),score=137.44 TRINITY_DN462_c4_g1_i1:33-2096(+)